MRFCQKMATSLNCERITFIVSWLGDLYAETFPLIQNNLNHNLNIPCEKNEKQDPKNSHLNKKMLI